MEEGIVSEVIVTTRKVSIQGVDYAEGADVSKVDPGSIESMLSMGWAKKVELKTNVIDATDTVNEPGVIAGKPNRNKK
jgi:hypothetical protein